MTIVAMSQSLGSLGDEIGRKLAQTLSYEFSDREIILRAAERFGQEVEKLEHVTDEKPTLWERFSESMQRYLTYVEAIIWEMAARDNVILSGRGAPFVLQKVRHALRVRITAPEGLRAKRVQQGGLTPEAAARAVQQNDRERASRVRFLFHVDVDDPRLYDLVLNTDRVDVNAAARLVQEALQNERFRPTPDSLAEIKDMSLIAHAKAALLAHPLTRELQLSQLSLSFKNGHFTISGIVEHEELQKAAVEVIGKIPGVIGVLSEITVTPRRPHHTGI
jgi:cytidylate kinase